MDESLSATEAAELVVVTDFLRGSLPFDQLDAQALEAAAQALRISYHPKGEIFEAQDPVGGLRILRSGAVDIRDGDNKLLDRLGEGESFHIHGLNAEDNLVMARVIEDALIYRLPDETYRSLRAAHRAFDRYFTGQRGRRLRRAARYEPEPNPMLAPVSSVMSRELLTVPTSATVRETAAAMAERRVSSAFVVEELVDDDIALRGIVTDRDLRTRVLALGVDAAVPITTVMTPDPEHIRAEDSLFETTLRMTRRRYHHLPVMEDGRLAGIVTTSDLILARRDDPVYLVQHISRQTSVEELSELVSGIGELMLRWTQGGMRARQVSQILTAISDAVASRLIALAEAELGAAPVPWVWLAFGSQARGEQLLGADQDNGIIVDDSASDDDLAWFGALAARVCDGLAACGYKYCPGGIMASNPEWCQRLSDWQETVRRWTRTPTNDAVMRVSIFFDIRAVHGDQALAGALQNVMLDCASRDTIFQAALAANVLATKPPLGVFRRFVVERDGGHKDSVNIKKRGVLPVTEIARLHALAARLPEVNTDRRLESLVKAGTLSIAASRDLVDALHCIQRLRMEHQCAQIKAKLAVDNHINPRRLPRLAREQLRDAFTIIDEAQAAVRQRYRAGMA
ncbi:MAG: DUF294 nucleotidyltransferase-like domain-containing protein [Congregibacter sp.]